MYALKFYIVHAATGLKIFQVYSKTNYECFFLHAIPKNKTAPLKSHAS